MSIDGFHAIIPAGGAGTRLWPLSRRADPKFLHDLTGTGRTLIQGTWDRLAPLAGPDGMCVVTGVAHVAAVVRQLPGLGAGNLFAEPVPRDSMPAIGLAAAVIARRDPQAVVGSFAADHVIDDVPSFHSAVAQAVETARAGYIVTIGIEPARPSTAFGYIQAGPPVGSAGAGAARHVVRFVEKPDAADAAAYVDSGEYRWNAGMFVARAQILMDELAACHPRLAAGLWQIASVWDTPRRAAAMAEVWPDLEKIAIDYAVAEPAAAAGHVAMVPGAFDWDDVGDWRSLGNLLRSHGEGDVRLLGCDPADVLVIDSPGALVAAAAAQNGGAPEVASLSVASPDRHSPLVAVLGIDDAVVVRTPDAILVTTREHAQAVKGVVDRLRAEGRDDLL